MCSCEGYQDMTGRAALASCDWYTRIGPREQEPVHSIETRLGTDLGHPQLIEWVAAVVPIEHHNPSVAIQLA